MLDYPNAQTSGRIRLLPEGLEQGLTVQDMADLLSFLQKPEGRLLPDVK